MKSKHTSKSTKRLIHVNDVVSLYRSLVFHHRDASTKSFELSQGPHRSYAQIDAEIAKVRYCVLTVTKHITTTKGQVVKDQKNISGMRSTFESMNILVDNNHPFIYNGDYD